ncbi:GntR family transcriptional regulator [Allocatelliglobosispora scoriae]|uniref:GntR family transcriptional regulator n=1 Tax=Allocatelliglobosispora scoriae TaxID=643052 RepID=A0A841BNT0_9ACTN|nr:GntR family transcriptional regulator [Allocatelliglobosispora scoriae]MBB5868956.1 GntR family transcriptional regulator [Allocatelliglobosispora scoriae]
MSSIEPSKSQYAQIADLLRSRIADGTYVKGSALPSEPELAAELRVSRVTINKAVGLLRATGLVKVKRGLGTYVATLSKIDRHASERFAVRDRGAGAGDVEIRSLGLQPRTDYGYVGPIGAPSAVAEALGIMAGTQTLLRSRALFADDEPTQLADSYYLWDMAKDSVLVQPDVGAGGSYARLADLGAAPVRFTEAVTVRMPDAAEQRKLDLDSGQPVFEIIHVAYDAADRPVSVTVHVMSGHLWTLHYAWADRVSPS